MKVAGGNSQEGTAGRRAGVARRGAAALEHAGCRPRDGELFRARAKPRESLVEARHGDNVQISSLKPGIVATDSSNRLVAGCHRHFSSDSGGFESQSRLVKIMISGIGLESLSTDSQTCNWACGRASF